MFFRTIARPLLASWFIYGGVQAILDPVPRAKRSAPIVEPALKEIGAEVSVGSLVQAHGIAQVIAATMLAGSKTPRTSALTLAGLATLTAVAGRPFWLEEDDAEREVQREAFVKNLSLLGGVMIAATAGKSSRRRKPAKKKSR